MRILIFLIASAGLAFAQLDSYSVTITVTQNAVVQPDQAAFAVYANTSTTAGLDTALAEAQGAGITASNLTGVSTVTGTGRSPQTYLLWAFSLTVPISAVNQTIAALSQLEVAGPYGAMVSFQLNGLRVSPQLQAAQTCPIPALMMDARIQAQQLAALAGFNLGPVEAMSDGSVGPNAGYSNIAVPALGLNVFGVSYSSIPGCTLVVKFALV